MTGVHARLTYAPLDGARMRKALTIVSALLIAESSAASAQIPDLHLPGALPGQLSPFGVGLRDALRQKLGICARPVGGDIVVCGHRPSYRIDRRVFEAYRAGGDYKDYLEASARHQGQAGN